MTEREEKRPDFGLASMNEPSAELVNEKKVKVGCKTPTPIVVGKTCLCVKVLNN